MLAGGTARLGRGPSRSPAADRELQHVQRCREIVRM